MTDLPSWLRGMITEQRFEDLVAGVVSLFDAMAERHAKTLFEFKQAMRQRYGRRSEQISDAQLELLFGLLQEQVAEAQTPALTGAAAELDEAQPREQRSEKSERRRRQAPAAWSPELPRETVVVPVPESEQRCPGCGERMAVCGHDASELLEYEPAQFRVRTIEREKRACRRCRDAVVRAPAPPRVVERGKLGAGLLAQILVSKYLEHSAPRTRSKEAHMTF